MELTREEREQVRARIGEMLTGEPITDAELENADARTYPPAREPDQKPLGRKKVWPN